MSNVATSEVAVLEFHDEPDAVQSGTVSPPKVRFEDLTGRQKVAVVLAQLREETGSMLLKAVGDEEAIVLATEDREFAAARSRRRRPGSRRIRREGQHLEVDRTRRTVPGEEDACRSHRRGTCRPRHAQSARLGRCWPAQLSGSHRPIPAMSWRCWPRNTPRPWRRSSPTCPPTTALGSSTPCRATYVRRWRYGSRPWDRCPQRPWAPPPNSWQTSSAAKTRPGRRRQAGCPPWSSCSAGRKARPKSRSCAAGGA